MNRIQSKDHRIGTFEINKFLLFCFDKKIMAIYNLQFTITVTYKKNIY